jgi:hypothetical protein
MHASRSTFLCFSLIVAGCSGEEAVSSSLEIEPRIDGIRIAQLDGDQVIAR